VGVRAGRRSLCPWGGIAGNPAGERRTLLSDALGEGPGLRRDGSGFEGIGRGEGEEVEKARASARRVAEIEMRDSGDAIGLDSGQFVGRGEREGLISGQRRTQVVAFLESGARIGERVGGGERPRGDKGAQDCDVDGPHLDRLSTAILVQRVMGFQWPRQVCA
jgi:hypothetical protein